MSNDWHADALAGGTVNLSGLTTINGPNAASSSPPNEQWQPAQPVRWPALPNSDSSTFEVTGSATALANSLTTVSGLQITLDGSGTIATSQWSSLTGGSSLTVTGGSYSLACRA